MDGTGPEDSFENPDTEADAGDASELELTREKYLRALADMENLRKGRNAHIDKALQNDRSKMLLDFLEALDSLQHALEAHEGETNEWHEGTRAISAQMQDIFKRHGATPFRCLNEPFDPERHEAVGRLAVPDTPDGVVVRVLQTGWQRSDGSILRPARVIVSYQGQE